ncbi:MAG: transposase [Acidimicrobiales bacterium]
MPTNPPWSSPSTVGWRHRLLLGEGHCGTGPRGFDRAKKINGIKRHIVVDSLGLLVAVLVTAGSVQDRAAAIDVLGPARHRCRRLTHIWADRGYTGQDPHRRAHRPPHDDRDRVGHQTQRPVRGPTPQLGRGTHVLHRREPRPMGGDSIGEDVDGGRADEADDEPSHLAARGPLRRGGRILDRVEDPRRPLEEDAPGVGESHPRAGPHEQRDAQLPLELANLLTKNGRG